MQLNKYIDHTILKAQATQSDIQKLCAEAKQYNFASVCVNACWIAYAKELLQGSDVNIACVVGFPLGATTTATKVFESVEAVKNGADEIDMVLNVGKMKDGDYDFVFNDIKQVVDQSRAVVKVILETCLLTKEEIAKATQIAVQAGAHFVKTSTGFSSGGATVEDVEIMKANCGNAHIKASGGIRDYDTAVAMIKAGATRLGTSSSINIVEHKETTSQ